MSTTSSEIEWREAKDPKTKRIYYYNIRTKETTWTKPPELISPLELESREKKKADAVKFFKEMEETIRDRCSGKLDVEPKNLDLDIGQDDTIALESFGPLPSVSMEGWVSGAASIECTPKRGKFFGDLVVDPPVSNSVGRKRRNSTGTVYIGSTLSQQDNEATIQCVCTVICGHMLDAATVGAQPSPRYDVFKDRASVFSGSSALTATALGEESFELYILTTEQVPSLEQVQAFFELVFTKSQLESECIIIALIYCERLMKVTKGHLCIRYDNWRSILFACLVMASKVWDDLSMWNVDFSLVDPTFTLQRINALELAMLEELRYVIRVPASEYATYYFHLRSMMVQLGLRSTDACQLEPLNIETARKLQLATEKFQADTDAYSRRRSKTISAGVASSNFPADSASSLRNGMDVYNSDSHHAPVGLEQLVHSEHVDADGLTHISHRHSANVLLAGIEDTSSGTAEGASSGSCSYTPVYKPRPTISDATDPYFYAISYSYEGEEKGLQAIVSEHEGERCVEETLSPPSDERPILSKISTSAAKDPGHTTFSSDVTNSTLLKSQQGGSSKSPTIKEVIKRNFSVPLFSIFFSK